MGWRREDKNEWGPQFGGYLISPCKKMMVLRSRNFNQEIFRSPEQNVMDWAWRVMEGGWSRTTSCFLAHVCWVDDGDIHWDKFTGLGRQAGIVSLVLDKLSVRWLCNTNRWHQTGSWISKSGALTMSGLKSNLRVTREQTVIEVVNTNEISQGRG